MKYILFLAVFVFCASAAQSQSSFKPLPKVFNYNRFVRGYALAPDSTIGAFRFIADIAAYAEPGNILMAGVGYGYQHLRFDYTTQKWNCQWSVNAIGFAGGSVVPSTPASIASIGVMVGINNNLFMVGPIYNPGTKQFGVAVSIGISLNN